MMISNLPKELVEEILSRLSIKDLRAVRCTCKKWNALTNDRSFANKQIEKVTSSSSSSGEKQFVMITEFSVYLIGINLLRTQNNDIDLSIKRKGTLVSLNSSVKAFHKSSQVIHCNGVFLCVWGNMLVLWNPYWRKTKWIFPRYNYGSLDMYALGYDNSTGSYKILRLFGQNQDNLDVYDLSSNSWMVPDATLDRDINERFGPRLPLPLTYGGNVHLSTLKDEQLVALIQIWHTMEIWVTNKIEPDAVSWSIFLKVDMEPSFQIGNFFIEEEKKVAVVFDQDWRFRCICYNAYIIGEDGYLKRVDLRKSPYTPLYPFACSYVPSSVQIK